MKNTLPYFMHYAQNLEVYHEITENKEILFDHLAG